MRIDVFTLFPGHFDWFTGQRHVQNALEVGAAMEFFDYRATTPLSGGQVDDSPYGGGAGMVLRVDVVDAALEAAYGEQRDRVDIIALDPTGRMLDDAVVTDLSHRSHVALLCGRYEGFDERVIEHLADESLSIGRYVLTGGELAAMVLADAILRKLPGALGDARSAEEESFSAALGGRPEYPHYTRPTSYKGWEVPDVLLSGDHERIHEWRLARSAERVDG